jgi:hypothetical protein
LDAVLDAVAERDAAMEGGPGGVPLALDNEAQAEAAMTAVAAGALPLAGRTKLPVKARALGVSRKRLRKVLKHAKQVRAAAL